MSASSHASPDVTAHGGLDADNRQVVYLPQPQTPPHERVVHLALARRLAALLGLAFGGEYRPGAPAPGRLYLVPARTLEDPDVVRALGIRSDVDLFGGAVALPWMATKVITHGLVAATAAAPAGWQPGLAPRLAAVVLQGYSAFSHVDAREAGLRLLRDGPVRLKPARACGGRGQAVVADAAALDAELAALPPAAFADGVVLEEDLHDAVTYSVGQLRLPGLLASYSGTQQLTLDNQGQPVYGGSQLEMVVGGFAALLAQPLPVEVRRAVKHAAAYDAAVSEVLGSSLLASRRNYDVVAGRNVHGEMRCGVLEQSWRIGGASGAEIAALECLLEPQAPARVVARVCERFGADVTWPASAQLLYRADDPAVGWITKFTEVVAPALGRIG